MKKNYVKNLVFSGLLVGIGILIPQLFHLSGVPDSGQVFLPMHIAIFLAGFMVGPVWGVGVGVITPILSSLFTGMPPIPRLYFMIFELATYAFVAGLCTGKWKLNPYFSLLISMICGRIVYGLGLVVSVYLFRLQIPFANTTAFFSGIVTGMPGIIIQLLIIPPIVFALKKGGYIFAISKGN